MKKRQSKAIENRRRFLKLSASAGALLLINPRFAKSEVRPTYTVAPFEFEEATIADLQAAMQT